MNQFIIDLVDSDPTSPSPVHSKTTTTTTTNNKFSQLEESNKNTIGDSCYKKYGSDLKKLSFVKEHANSSDTFRLNNEDDLSPLEDFYSLKNADENDQDAQYFLNMFKRTEQQNQKSNRNPLKDVQDKLNDDSSSRSSYWNSLDNALNDPDDYDNCSSTTENVNNRKRITKGTHSGSSKRWFKGRNKS